MTRLVRVSHAREKRVHCFASPADINTYTAANVNRLLMDEKCWGFSTSMDIESKTRCLTAKSLEHLIGVITGGG